MKTVAQVASRLEKFCGGGLTRKKQDLACRVIYSEPHRQFNSRKLRHNHIRNQQIGSAVLSVPECIQGVCKRLRQETGHLQYFCRGFGDDSFIVRHENSAELVFRHGNSLGNFLVLSEGTLFEPLPARLSQCYPVPSSRKPRGRGSMVDVPGRGILPNFDHIGRKAIEYVRIRTNFKITRWHRTGIE